MCANDNEEYPKHRNWKTPDEILDQLDKVDERENLNIIYLPYFDDDLYKNKEDKRYE